MDVFFVQLQYKATGAVGVLGLLAVRLVDLAFASDRDCVTIRHQCMEGKGAVEATCRLSGA